MQHEQDKQEKDLKVREERLRNLEKRSQSRRDSRVADVETVDEEHKVNGEEEDKEQSNDEELQTEITDNRSSNRSQPPTDDRLSQPPSEDHHPRQPQPDCTHSHNPMRYKSVPRPPLSDLDGFEQRDGCHVRRPSSAYDPWQRPRDPNQFLKSFDGFGPPSAPPTRNASPFSNDPYAMITPEKMQEARDYIRRCSDPKRGRGAPQNQPRSDGTKDNNNGSRMWRGQHPISSPHGSSSSHRSGTPPTHSPLNNGRSDGQDGHPPPPSPDGSNSGNGSGLPGGSGTPPDHHGPPYHPPEGPTPPTAGTPLPGGGHLIKLNPTRKITLYSNLTISTSCGVTRCASHCMPTTCKWCSMQI